MARAVKHPDALRWTRDWASDRLALPCDQKLADKIGQGLADVLSRADTPATAVAALGGLVGNYVWNVHPDRRDAEAMLESVIRIAKDTLDEVYKAEEDDRASPGYASSR